jgi:hypothetical protein
MPGPATGFACSLSWLGSQPNGATTPARCCPQPEAHPGQQFTAAGQTPIRIVRPYGAPGNIWAHVPATGEQRFLNREEDQAFWAWVIIEVLRMTWMAPSPLLFQRRTRTGHDATNVGLVADLLDKAPARTGLTDPATGRRLRFTPHYFRRLFITGAVLNGLPPHIARSSPTTRTSTSRWAAKPAIRSHLAFLGRRRALRLSGEYRTPRQPHRPHRRSPARGLDRRSRRTQVSLAGADEKLAQIDRQPRGGATVDLGPPPVRIEGR